MQEVVWACGAYQYPKERMLDSRNENAFWTTPAAGYERGLGTAFFAERAAQTAHWGYAALQGFGTFAQAPEDVLQSVDYPEALP